MCATSSSFQVAPILVALFASVLAADSSLAAVLDCGDPAAAKDELGEAETAAIADLSRAEQAHQRASTWARQSRKEKSEMRADATPLATAKADVDIKAAEVAENAAKAWKDEAQKRLDAVQAARSQFDRPDGSAGNLATCGTALATALDTGGVEKARATYEAQAGKSNRIFQDILYDTSHFFLQAGLVTLAPFQISKKRGTRNDDNNFDEAADGERVFALDDSSDLDVRGFMEIRAYNDDLWNVADDLLRYGTGVEGIFGACSAAQSGHPCRCWAPSNIEARFGFLFNAEGDATANTAVGSGDLYGTFSFGWPLFRVVDKDISWSLNLEGVIDVVTDREVQDVHDREGVGLGVSIAVPIRAISITGKTDESGDPIKRLLKFHIRGSFNAIEVPNETNSDFIAKDDPDKRTVIEEDGGYPKFQTDPAYGMDVDLLVPIGTNGYVVIGSSIFGPASPNPWAVRLGITVPLERLLGIITDPFS
ncbi:MAG: hypothetical protein ACQGVK_24950 [Myxococcota bacterium]